MDKYISLPRIMHQRIIIFDFGSQYTQLIARRLRELNVYCEIVPFYKEVDWTIEKAQGVILSGSPASVNDVDAPDLDIDGIPSSIPVLGICYGAQLMVHKLGGKIEPSISREYGAAELQILKESSLLENVDNNSKVWMSHGDSIYDVPKEVNITASTKSIPCAVFNVEGRNWKALQFHPEVYHSKCGLQVLKNFLYNTCKCVGDWTPAHFVDETVENLKAKLGNDKVILGLSGGVDSSVAAILLQKAIGDNLHCIFVNNGLLRKNEYDEVLEQYKQLNLNIKGVDASDLFYDALKGLKDPETKRKAIGKVFVDVFQTEANKIEDAKWLGQGTIYPDVIESVSVKGPSQTIKSHHNVGGLPKDMKLKVVEPLRELFKDEVRRVGSSLHMPKDILARHPFPGPGLGIRILGDITKDKVAMLQDADAIFINLLKENGLYDEIWQAGTMLLPVKSVGVMGDERTYEKVVALRAVGSTDGMTADWYPIPYDVLGEISNQIINKVKGINRVVYDISSKPPSTIEWE